MRKPIIFILLALLTFPLVCEEETPYYYINGSANEQSIYFTFKKALYPDSLPELLNYTKYPYIGISFNNYNGSKLPKEFFELKNTKQIRINGSSGSLYNLVSELYRFPNLEYIVVEDVGLIDFTALKEQIPMINDLMINRCDTLIVSKYLINPSVMRYLNIQDVNNIIFDDSIKCDSISTLSIHKNYLKSKIKFTNLNNFLSNVKYFEKLFISPALIDVAPQNMNCVKYFALEFANLKEFPTLEDCTGSLYLNLSGNQFKNIDEKIYSRKEILELDFSYNSLTNFRFDLINNSTFETIPDSIIEEYWQNTNIIYNMNKIILDWNLIDSIPTFIDTNRNKDYLISLNYNNRKCKSGNTEFEIKEYKDFDKDQFTFSIPKGLFNLQFRGRLNLIGYNLNEDEKTKIRKHFRHAVVFFDEEKQE